MYRKNRGRPKIVPPNQTFESLQFYRDCPKEVMGSLLCVAFTELLIWCIRLILPKTESICNQKSWGRHARLITINFY